MKRVLAIAAMVVARAHEEGFAYELLLDDGLSGVQPQQWLVALIESGLQADSLAYVANQAVKTDGIPSCLIPDRMSQTHSIIAEAALKVPLDNDGVVKSNAEAQPTNS